MTELPLLHLVDGVITRNQVPLITKANISLEVGEIALLTGPNGSGKSTLLTALAGEKFLSEGTLMFGDTSRDQISLRNMATKRSLMLQQDEAVDQLRASDVLELANISPATPSYTTEFVSKIFNSELGAKTLGTLSIGQRTRVFLAAAALQNSEVMLLDEPTAGLDSEGISVLAEFLVTHASQGHAVLIATHEHSLNSLAKKEFAISDGTLSVKSRS
jgi:zinc/manganese transport system ATP-binding protein